MSSQASRCLVLDSGAIIALAEIGMAVITEVLDTEIIVPQAVYEEVVIKGHGRPGSEELKDLMHQGKVRVLKPRNTACEAT